MHAITRVALSLGFITTTLLPVTPAWAHDEIPVDVIQLIRIDACTAIDNALELQSGTVIEFELDVEHGQPVYEIEIMADRQSVEIKVHGITGKALRDNDHSESDD